MTVVFETGSVASVVWIVVMLTNCRYTVLAVPAGLLAC